MCYSDVMYTDTLDNKNIIFEKVVCECSNLLKISSDTKIFIDEKVISTTWLPSKIASLNASGLNGIIHKILLDVAHNSEKLSPGSSNVTLLTIISCLQNINQYCNDSDDALSIVRAESKKILGEELQTSLGIEDRLFQIFKNAYKIGGMTSRYDIDLANSTPQIRLEDGYTFNLSHIENVCHGTWEYDNVKVMLVDGLIESVSEINAILLRSNQQNEPLVILARGFSDDVIHTLSVNFARKTLNVIPVKTPYDEVHANTLKDIACLLNSNVISSLTGDLISTAKYDDLAIARRVISKGGKLIIGNHPTPSLKSHVKELIRLREEASEEKKTLYDKRIKSLTSSRVKILIPKDWGISKDEIVRQFYTSSAFIRTGTLNLSNISETENFFIRNLSKQVKSIPVSHALTAIKLASQAVNDIRSIGAVILEDKNGRDSLVR